MTGILNDFLELFRGQPDDYIQAMIFGLCLGGVYALMASGQTLVFGVMRIVNLSHPVFIIIAAYLSYETFTRWGLDPLISVAINFPIMFLIGVLVYRSLLAREVDNPRYAEITVLLTFAIALIVEGMLGEIYTGTNRSTRPPYTTEAFFWEGYIIPKAQLYAAIMSVALISAVWAFLQYSRMGYAIRATTQNRAAAQIVGVNVANVSTFSFGLGMGLAGAAGALMSFLFSFYPNYHWEWVALLLSLIVLGGMGKLMGAVVGAFLLAMAAAIVSNRLGPTWSPLTFYLSLFVILLIRPQGLFGKKMEMV